MRRLSVLCFSSCFTGALLALAADRAAAQRLPRLTYEEYRLDNGLRVILAPNPRAAVVAVDLTYDVGSRNEEKGRTGFAHLFEHMLFEGSAGLARGEVYKILEGVVAGGFEPANAKALIPRYFADIPRGTGDAGPPPTCDAGFAAGARRRHVVDAKAPLPAVARIYTVPAYDHADYAPLELLVSVLGKGETSRINRTLVRQQKVAAGALMGLNERDRRSRACTRYGSGDPARLDVPRFARRARRRGRAGQRRHGG